MKKWQVWTLVSLGLIVLVGAGVAATLVVNNAATTTTTTTKPAQVQSAEEKSLTDIKNEVEQDDDLDTAEVEDAVKELDAIDLSGV